MTDFNTKNTAEHALTFLRRKTKLSPQWALVLGSGLGSLASRIKNRTEFAYADVPGFKQTSVSGHDGRIILGYWDKQPVVVFCGRMHFYEGHSMEQVCLPIHLAARLGAKQVILTCAAGSTRKKLPPGSIALIRDHVNFMGENPLRASLAPNRFVDMTQCYDADLRRLALRCARAQKIKLTEAVYWAFAGPSYETAAEVALAARLGADVIGMSMVPEVVAARQQALRVLGLAVVSNFCTGIGTKTLNHQEVLQQGQASADKLISLLDSFFKQVKI